MNEYNTLNTPNQKTHIIRFKRLYNKKLISSSTSAKLKDLLSSEKLEKTILNYMNTNRIVVKKISIQDFNDYSFIKFSGSSDDYRKVYNYLNNLVSCKLIIIVNSKKH